MESAVATAFFVLCAVVLGGSAFGAMRSGRLSSVVVAALAGYAVILAFSAETLIAEFGAARFMDAAAIYAVGTVVLVATLNLAARRSRWVPIAWGDEEQRRHVRWSMRLAVVSLTLFYVDRTDPLISWSEARADAGLLTVIATFCLLLATSGLVSAFRTSKWVSAVTLLLLCAASFVLSGSRAAVLAAVMLWLWTLTQQTRSRGRVLLVLAGVGTAVLLLHTVLRFVRGVSLLGLLEAIQSGTLLSDFLAGAASDVSGGEAAIARYFVYATTVDSTQEFGVMTSLQRLLLIAVPHVEGLIDKPLDVTYRLWAKAFEQGLFDGAAGQQLLFDSYLTGSLGSLHATLFGEMFLSGGLGALVISVIFVGLVLAAIDRYFRHASPFTALVLTGPVLVGYLMTARGNSVIGLGYFVYLATLVAILRTIGCIALGIARTCASVSDRLARQEPER